MDRTAVRQDLILHGLVQGVGCRPWVYQQATQRSLSGWVRNTPQGVEVRLEGPGADIDSLVSLLPHMPFPARVECIEKLPQPADGWPPVAAGVFQILESTASDSTHAFQRHLDTHIGTDLATCRRCLSELFNPNDRRWRHPFIHCPQCGPRYTVVSGMPFDRAHTSLASMAVCPQCMREFQSPTHHRFHDQTTCCTACGPRLSLWRHDGTLLADNTSDLDPIAQTLALIQAGHIVAIKGIGGFHLCCNARDADAVARLRQRKQRPSKPLAIMAANLPSLKRWVHMQPQEEAWLTQAGRPIVLLPQTPQAQQELAGIAPGLVALGAMLPYAPVHHLLFHEAAQRPAGTTWMDQVQELLLVMTSANLSGSPLVISHDEAWQQLPALADALLLHDREILHRADDSVLRVRPDGSACWLRRGRGYAPEPLVLGPALHRADVVACGGDLKNTICQIRTTPHGQWEAVVSPHIGNLDGAACRQVYQDQLDRMGNTLSSQTSPRPASPTADRTRVVACDLHPDFFSHRTAANLAHRHDANWIPVQHHHAHVGAVLAEYAAQGHTPGAVMALALDGFGLGTDGRPWGGELLRVHGAECIRLSHLRPLLLPGGEKAAREPWRLAAAVLHDLGRTTEIASRWPDQPQARALQAWLQQQSTQAQPASQNMATTSLGRLFDAAAALLGLTALSDYEGHAAMLLEACASPAWPTEVKPPLVRTDASYAPKGESGIFPWDWRELMQSLMRFAGDTKGRHQAAAHFHATLAQGLAQWVGQACREYGLNTVVLTGGCLANRLLDDRLTELIQAQDLRVWRASQYPCGDGGLSLGQAWVALQSLSPPPVC